MQLEKNDILLFFLSQNKIDEIADKRLSLRTEGSARVYNPL